MAVGTTGLDIQGVILAIILGTLAGIVYSLRVLVLMERRIARIDLNLENITKRILTEELKIEAQEERIAKEEKEIEKKFGKKKASKKPAKGAKRKK